MLHEKTGVGKVQRNPNLALWGIGILVGIIDTGIDYTHPAFLYRDETSRILSLWDQTIQDGAPPEGINYGTEYKKEQINQALKCDNPYSIVPSMDKNGRGTAIASIAAGSQHIEKHFSGIVPFSELVVVKLKEEDNCYKESDVILAIHYLLNVAKKMRRPIALCVDLDIIKNDCYGIETTMNYLEYINQIPQVGVVISGGKKGNCKKNDYAMVDSKTYQHEFELKVSEKEKILELEIWSYPIDGLSIEVTTPIGEITGEIFPQINKCQRFEFLYESSTIWIEYSISKKVGDQVLRIRLEKPLGGVWSFQVRNVKNKVSMLHAWLSSVDLISRDTFFLKSNHDSTFASAENTPHCMTVFAYNQENNSIIPESGGNSRNDNTEPDVAAPGFKITCATLNGTYGTITGSRAAIAYTVGIVGMILEWSVLRGKNTSIKGNDIRNLIIQRAVQDEENSYQDKIGGYGRINVDGLFQ